MQKVEIGDTVKLHYKAEFEDETICESTFNEEPVTFTIGNNEIITGLEYAVIGMDKGEQKKVQVPYENGYGPYKKDLVVTIDRQKHPYPEPEIGQMLKIVIPNENGPSHICRVIDFSDSTVTLDANHPLAGKNLIFHVELVEVEKNAN